MHLKFSQHSADRHLEISKWYCSISVLDVLLACASQVLKIVAVSPDAGDEDPFVSKNCHNRAFFGEDNQL